MELPDLRRAAHLQLPPSSHDLSRGLLQLLDSLPRSGEQTFLLTPLTNPKPGYTLKANKRRK